MSGPFEMGTSKTSTLAEENIPPRRKKQRGQDGLQHVSGHCLFLSGKRDNTMFVTIEVYKEATSITRCWLALLLHTCMSKNQSTQRKPSTVGRELLTHGHADLRIST